MTVNLYQKYIEALTQEEEAKKKVKEERLAIMAAPGMSARSVATSAFWAKPGTKARMSIAIKKGWTPEAKARQSKALIARHARERAAKGPPPAGWRDPSADYLEVGKG